MLYGTKIFLTLCLAQLSLARVLDVNFFTSTTTQVPSNYVSNDEFKPIHPSRSRFNSDGNFSFIGFVSNEDFTVTTWSSTWTVVWPGQGDEIPPPLEPGWFNTETRRILPDFNFQYVKSRNWLVSVSRGPQASNHPYWQYNLGGGSRCWREAADGEWDRCVLILTVNEKGNNCIFNGVGMFLINPDTSVVTNMYFQFTAGTCAYYKWVARGLVPGTFTNVPVSNRGQVISAFNNELNGRMEVRGITELPEDVYRNNNLNPEDAPDWTLESNPIAYGKEYAVVYDGALYASPVSVNPDLDPSVGDYPYPEWALFPLYSLTKTNYASTLAGVLDEMRGCRFAATPTSTVYNKCIRDLVVADWVPEVAARPDHAYAGVTMNYFLGETTGVYNSTTYGVDEGSGLQNVYFFYRFTDAEKTDFAVNAWTYQPGMAGNKFNYHTTDTYIGTKALRAIIKKHYPGQDIGDFYKNNFADVLDLSPNYASPIVTADAAKQPFGGYGLNGYYDDYAKIAEFWAFSKNYGKQPHGSRLLNSAWYKAAQQMSATDRGLLTGRSSVTFPNQRYQLAWWSADLIGLGSSTPNLCPNPKINYQSGFGGIRMYIANTAWSYISIGDGYVFPPNSALNALVELGAGCPQGLILDPPPA